MGNRHSWRIGLATLALVAVAGCTGTGTAASATGKYDQTWTTGYADTTCADWDGKMTEHQRWVAAADMLVNGRKTWDIDAMPADSLVDTFEGDITQGCDPSDATDHSIVDTATALLLMGGKAQYGG